MDELEQIRQRKLAEMQSSDVGRAAEQVAQAEVIVKKAMTKEAVQRYGTVKLAHPEVAMGALAVMFQMLQTGKLQHVTDDTLKELLKNISPKKRDIKIRHK